MNLGDFRKATEGLPDDTPILYAWLWRSPTDLSLGTYLGAGDVSCLLLDGDAGQWREQFGNRVLWKEPPSTFPLPQRPISAEDL